MAPDLAEVLAATSAALRSGSPPGEAWRRTLGSPTGPDGLPAWGSLVALDRSPGGQGRHARAVLAACRLARSLGAPLAPVLDRVAEAVAADAELDAERRAALAGPRSTAAVLGWLPVLGLLLGFALGADPVEVVLRGGLGAASALLGGALLLLGRWWTARLLAHAASAGDIG
ncbi:type II secretion protein F [Cellulomonas cellasea]|uniref:type II secretion system F family protein n=1 Tax=Cellulomonas cellasea TaxID=43670 RepID=UPI0025A4B7D7|nr:type II secretion system F family protein [Cellulomonas cellasea]MDM8085602.1 type II secretion protein F [Cellulomonas cellasea]